MKIRSVLLWSISGVFALGGAWLVLAHPSAQAHGETARPASTESSQTIAKARVVVDDGDPTEGPENARVTLFFFVSYGVRDCLTMQRLVDDAVRSNPSVRLVWKNAPTPFSEKARRWHLAALAAARVGKFRAFHDRLLAATTETKDPDLDQIAKAAGIDPAALVATMDDPEIERTLDSQERTGQALGVMTGPELLVGGRRLKGLQTSTAIAQAIREARPAFDDGKANARVSIPIRRDDPTEGSEAAPVTIVEFSDFTCPSCRVGAVIMHALMEKYEGKVRLVFKQFPLLSPLGAQAALAAQEQGKFWNMHDRLFACEKRLSRKTVMDLAQTAGLDLLRFRGALDTGRFENRVTADMQAARALGVESTPTFFVNGLRVDGIRSAAEFAAIIDRELARAAAVAASTR